MKLSNSLVVLDLETTGTWIDKDKIVELAMIKCTPEQERLEFLERIKPGIPIPPRISELIGISDKDIEKAPSFKDIAQRVFDFIGDADIGGFNVERFDLPLLSREFQEAGIKFDWQKRKIFDAQKIYHLHEKRDLVAAYQFYCQKELQGAHSALMDTKAALDVLEQQVMRYGQGEIDLEVLSQYDYRQNAEYFDDERKFRWWNGKLYMMFGRYAKTSSLQEIVKKDRAYLEWILSANFSQEVKTLVEDALNGKFPTFEGKV